MTMVNTAIDDRILPLIESHTDRLAELETYTRSQLAAVRDELRVSSAALPITGKTVIGCEGVPTTTSQEKPNTDGDTKTFTQLDKQLNYPIPEGVKATSPRTEGAEDLIAFAATLGQSYKWDGKKQKFYRTDAN